MSTEHETLGDFLQNIRDGKMKALPTSDGGYLVPEIIQVNSPGKKAALWRWLGRLLNSPKLYKRGREDFNVLQAMRAETERAMREIQK